MPPFTFSARALFVGDAVLFHPRQRHHYLQSIQLGNSDASHHLRFGDSTHWLSIASKDSSRLSCGIADMQLGRGRGISSGACLHRRDHQRHR